MAESEVLLASALARHGDLEPGVSQLISSLPVTVATLKPGELFSRRFGDAIHCALLVRGFACRYRLSAGRRQILTVNLPGDFLNLEQLFLRRSVDHIEALGLAEVAVFDCRQFSKLAATDVQLTRALAVLITVESSIISEWLLNVGRRGAQARIAHMLAELGYRWEAAGLGARDRFELPLTQDQLSDCIGTTVHYTNRVLKSLETEGLIRRDRRTLQIADWDALCRLGEFDPAYLHVHGQVDEPANALKQSRQLSDA